MTDPLQLESATDYYSDATETVLTSPAISISSVALGPFGRRVSATATNHQPSATSRPVSTRDFEPADDTNPSPEAFLTSGQHHLGLPSVTVQDIDSEQNVDTDNPSSLTSAKLALAPFGSDTRNATFPGPYLDFAPRPIYQPTGQLLHEQPGTFERFDIPVNPRTLTTANSHHDLSSSSDRTASAITSAQHSKAVNVFAQPSLPRSALKRKAEVLESPLTRGSNDATVKPQAGRPSKPRSVSFERMSGPGPTSPEEGSTSSDFNAGQRRSGHTTQRHARQSSASIPQAALQSTSGTSQNKSRSSRGNRDPSAHPPSILPPEKVFPIQIGSELFRLSGASISSDGKISCRDKQTVRMKSNGS